MIIDTVLDSCLHLRDSTGSLLYSTIRLAGDAGWAGGLVQGGAAGVEQAGGVVRIVGVGNAQCLVRTCSLQW